jgi:hypothetical protein
VFIGGSKSFSAFDFSGSNTETMEVRLFTLFPENSTNLAGNQIRPFKNKALEPPMNTDEHR